MNAFVPALIVVDFQQDFCPPNGSLAVPDGLSIATPINDLLSLPFTLRLATRDWHPPDHISFKTNHPESISSEKHPHIQIIHPEEPSRSYQTALWPPHCIQNSPGAELVPSLNQASLDAVFDKGLDSRFEMYSAFYDPFRICDSGIAACLAERAVTHVYVVGLAADYCVSHTAKHASELGFVSYIIDEATRPVDSDAWPDPTLGDCGVTVVSIHGDEVARVKALSDP
ncbi:hypothetical protein XA68_18016 [Ophiocordyceps unilateralis]|uniref:nicotinamidase n=1 Tax=Ophiocordyceps unilateralis TaxID=268505 RepID=A0A2A9PJZ3_OPHUN|nr:hypothetical protein XA68_18016 [Ophiocordyceps unilateralis]